MSIVAKPGHYSGPSLYSSLASIRTNTVIVLYTRPSLPFTPSVPWVLRDGLASQTKSTLRLILATLVILCIDTSAYESTYVDCIGCDSIHVHVTSHYIVV